MTRLRAPALAAAAAILLPALAAAQSAGLLQGPLPPPPSPSAIMAETPVPVAVKPVLDDRISFNTPEQWIIPAYFARIREKQKRATRLKRYDRALPAGLTQKPAKGDRLPLSVLADLHRLPTPLLRDLPPARPNTDRVVVGNDVMMVRTDSGEVLDIMGGVIH